ncbi:MAG: hypothetical protein AVDCRST_MAG28-2369 [uncultured Rubrobacteraceae bacterium]|uniref:Uncharacterized protein n=1 Tax=uncultured Rubrobacteraceae bacterium TaxID=349277 RepID=A0A6J4QZG1_9ACTN|nr:MAG: hypothetical protein AVDCRST_MAG28-2369 [uncultured Rubrobacteraceae bacterium]
MIEIPLIFALELAVLYLAGSYAMVRLARLLGFRSGGVGLGRVTFYLLVLPGVTLHEAAHYLACLLTGTRVSRFVPFWPQRSASGRLLLGYVRHESRPFPVEAVIGLAPILFNPLGVLVVTALLTPLTLAQVTDPQFDVVHEVVLTSGFLTGSPLAAAAWIYLSLSFALGSVPSREDLSSVPAALLFFGGGVFIVGFLRGGSESTITEALYDLSALAVRVYSLPTTVAVVAAVAIGLWGRTTGR